MFVWCDDFRGSVLQRDLDEAGHLQSQDFHFVFFHSNEKYICVIKETLQGEISCHKNSTAVLSLQFNSRGYSTYC